MINLKTMILLILVSSFSMILTYRLLTLSILQYCPSSMESSNSLDVKTNDPVTESLDNSKQLERTRRPFHVAVTTTSHVYAQWQCRIAYYWYKKMKDLEGSEMGGFTRILHSGEPDKLMNEIPTFVVQPLPSGVDRGYIVLHRPWAFVQWLEKANIVEEYILMSEPDHLFVNPLPNLSRDDHPAAYYFFYMRPSSEAKRIIRKYYPEDKGPVTNVQPIGNSPVIINKSLLRKIAPTWMMISLQMKLDAEADEGFGWILEMFAYAVASALHDVKHKLYKQRFMVEPPWDKKVGNASIIHYTYPYPYPPKDNLTYGRTGEWSFDKRSYEDRPFSGNYSLPPPGVPESVVTLIKKMNEAVANIPDWDIWRQ